MGAESRTENASEADAEAAQTAAVAERETPPGFERVAHCADRGTLGDFEEGAGD
jgi:hypothetical protein